MTAGWAAQPPLFKRAVVISSILHVLLFVFVVTAPRLPTRQKPGLVQYVSFLGFPGGGGGGTGSGGGPGGAAAKAAPAPAAKKETLRDLTVASKVKSEPPPAALRYPVDKPKRDKAAPPEKKATITRPDIGLKPIGAETAGEVPGASQGASGVRIGVGGEGAGGGTGGGGGGFGGGGGGLGNFPYAWYLQVIMSRVSENWFTSLVDPGVAGTYQTVVYFRIHRDGSVSDLKVETSSGIASLDVSAQRAVQASAPFPPLPSEYEDQFLGIHLIFEHSK
jgi:TonB family protein